MASISFVAGVDLVVGGKIRPAGSEVPEAATWKNLGAYIRTGQLVLRGAGADAATQQYKREQPRGRPLDPRKLREAIAAGEDADADLEEPLLDPDEATGEAMEKAGVTAEDLAEDLIAETVAQATGEDEADEGEAVETDEETPRRRRRGGAR